MSAHQLHRMLGVTYKTAWFMAHRIREAMAEDPTKASPMGGEGKIVEADETYFGDKETITKRTRRGKASSLRQSVRSSRWSSVAARFARSMSIVLTPRRCATSSSATSTRDSHAPHR